MKHFRFKSVSFVSFCFLIMSSVDSPIHLRTFFPPQEENDLKFWALTYLAFLVTWAVKDGGEIIDKTIIR